MNRFLKVESAKLKERTEPETLLRLSAIGEGLQRKEFSLFEPMNLVGTRPHIFRNEFGTRWNASLPGLDRDGSWKGGKKVVSYP
jgi:hypothetical protein